MDADHVKARKFHNHSALQAGAERHLGDVLIPSDYLGRVFINARLRPDGRDESRPSAKGTGKPSQD